MTTTIKLDRPPADPDELWHVVNALWGVALPDRRVCENHVSPFAAFSDAYFAHDPNWALWYGSRGTGKSYMLALLALTKAALLDVDVTLLGGSMAQSVNVREHVDRLLRSPNAPRYALAKPPTATEVKFAHNNWIRPIPASQTTVRGPHPALVCLDEIDEMEHSIYTAAQGQAMEQRSSQNMRVPEMTVASSTWQNPEGTFTKVYREAESKKMPVHSWCFKEVLTTPENPHGWMSPEFIERKRRSVPAEMFRVEYELGEPSGMALAFDMASLQRAFTNTVAPIDVKTRGEDEEYTYENPDRRGTYAAGADWAKEKDFTVFVVVRTDTDPWRTAYVRKFNRRPWPYMIEAFEKVVKSYEAVSAHDATGLGNVVHDLVDSRTTKILMVGKDRTKLLTDYITAVEQGRYALARTGPLYAAHRSVTVDEVFGSSNWKSHLADEVAACAIAHRAAVNMAPPISGDIVTRGKGGVKWIEELDGAGEAQRSMTVLQEVGVVTVQEEVSDVGVFWLD
jgi:hypothetical protein